jgi:hypothetical protein
MRLQEEENDNTKQSQTDASGIGGQYFLSGNVIFEMVCNGCSKRAQAMRRDAAAPVACRPVVSSNLFWMRMTGVGRPAVISTVIQY